MDEGFALVRAAKRHFAPLLADIAKWNLEIARLQAIADASRTDRSESAALLQRIAEIEVTIDAREREIQQFRAGAPDNRMLTSRIEDLHRSVQASRRLLQNARESWTAKRR